MSRTIEITWHCDTGEIVAPSSLWIKRSETVVFSLSTKSENALADLPAGFALALSLKPSVVNSSDPTQGEFDDSPLMQVTSWATSATGIYTASAEASSAEIDAFLNKNGDGTDDLTQPLTVGDFYFSVAGSLTYSDTFPLRLKNNVGRSDDGTPTAVANPGAWLQANGIRNPGYWTAYTGGAETNVDYIVTASGATATGSCVATAILGDFAVWQLQAGTAAENTAGGIIRPDDYNSTTNARVWVRIS
jgi:hypothetical protein